MVTRYDLTTWPKIQSLLGLPAKVTFRLNQSRQVVLHDASDIASLALTADALHPKPLARRDYNVWFVIFRLFIPLLPLENQSPRRG